ncbi:hypothetical protein [Yoonia algicola]|uniref:PH domain-containing protein n=1 Tax=Yoonia algicola TaxID=3137368 RepID=A0AAN0M786_9RHOB
MSDVYEYRRAPNKGPIWLAFIGVVLLFVAVIYFETTQLQILAWGLGAVLIAWMLLPKPVSGIRIDADHLTLAAWRKPRPIPLDDIAHLRVSDAGIDTEVAIVYRNGDVEDVFSGDLPDINTLIAVLAERGIPVRDVS